MTFDVIIFDLESKYQETKSEKRDDLFFLKIASYGKYLTEHNSIHSILTLLYDQSKKDVANFESAWQDFFKKWEILAKDLVETAERIGIKDESPLENAIAEIKDRLNTLNLGYVTDEPITSYYRSYSTLLEKFKKQGKENLIADTHLEKVEGFGTKVDIEYNKANTEWEKFKRAREISVWWAHYQVMRATFGVFGGEEKKHYFNSSNRIINGIYGYEFEQISKDANYQPVYLKRYRFEEWITRLHNFLIPRLKNHKVDQSQIQPKKSDYLKIRYEQLLSEIKSKQKSPDLEERYEKLLEEVRSNQSSPINTSQSPAARIEITKMPELQIKGFEEKELPKIKKSAVIIPIKDVRLDKQSYLLEINNGEKIIPFKSRKKGEGLEKETKQFKILYHLWDFRWELKDGKVLKKGDFASLDNLMRGGDSESPEAAYKHIQRLNNRFKNEGVAIEIKGENGKYRLIINKA